MIRTPVAAYLESRIASLVAERSLTLEEARKTALLEDQTQAIIQNDEDYEHLLSCQAVMVGDKVDLRPVRGSDRKLSGTFYTPQPLIDLVLELSLEPLLKEREHSLPALLAVRIFDPACGSGRFLRAAGERLMQYAARIRPTISFEEIATVCLCGADIDPLAVALARRRLPAARLLCTDSLRAELRKEFHVEGFDLVIGNPPWEQSELKEKEWASRYSPEVLSCVTGHARKRALRALETTNQAIFSELQEARLAYATYNRELGATGRFTTPGRINLYALFAELGMQLLTACGRLGIIVPTGIAVDRNNSRFFSRLIESGRLRGLLDFENRRKYFPGVDSRFRFSVLSCAAEPSPDPVPFVFLAQDIEDVSNAGRRIFMRCEDLSLFNPMTKTVPLFRSTTDLELSRGVYTRLPVFARSGWCYTLRQGLFNMTCRSHLFVHEKDRHVETHLPLYEAKYMHFFSHRWASYDGENIVLSSDSQAADPQFSPRFRFWVAREEVDKLLPEDARWLLCYRGISNPTNERTFIPTILPRAGVGNSLSLILLENATISRQLCLCANLSSLVFDYLFRSKMSGTNVNFFLLEQAPVLPPDHWAGERESWVLGRASRLLAPLPISGTFPLVSADERAVARAELDAMFLRWYGFSRHEAEHVLASFPVLCKNERKRWGEFRTGRLVLEAFDLLS